MVEAATLLLVLDVVERVLSMMVLPGLIAVLSVEKKKKSGGSFRREGYCLLD